MRRAKPQALVAKKKGCCQSYFVPANKSLNIVVGVQRCCWQAANAQRTSRPVVTRVFPFLGSGLANVRCSLVSSYLKRICVAPGRVVHSQSLEHQLCAVAIQ